VDDVLEAFPDLAHLPVSEVEGRELRVECIDEARVERELTTGEGETVKIEEVTERTAVPMWKAVAEMLEWHAGYHKSALKLEYGVETDPHHEEFTTPLENAWMAEAQEQERARLKGLERETVGHETCEECETRRCQETDDHETEWVDGAFERPVVALTGRTAAGDGQAPADHAREIADAWGPCRRTLRYITDKLGLENHEWVRWTQGEPHPGEKAGSGFGGNTGYHHAHDVMIFDAAAADGEIETATFRPLIEKHVEKCESAGVLAHDLEKDWENNPESVETVEVKEVEEEIGESVASYAAGYLANTGEDLLERSPEYLMWAATMWATETRKATGTDSRTHAVKADRCKHAHHTGEQETAHGESVVRSEKRGYSLECGMCGSPWELDQEQTLSSARLSDGPEVAADGGQVELGERADVLEEDLRERWPSARSAMRVETRPGEHGGVESARGSFGRPPCWNVVAVVVEGEERPASGGGGVDKRPLRRPSAKIAGLPESVEVVEDYAGHEVVETENPEESDRVEMQRGGDMTVYRCRECGFHSFDVENVYPDGAGHAGGDSRCEACVGESPPETARPDVPLMWPDAATDGGGERETEAEAEATTAREEIVGAVLDYLEERGLEADVENTPTVAGGLAGRGIDAPPDRVREVLANE
jgi:hypothetical protein